MSYSIRIEPLGIQISCEEEQSVLDALLRQGLVVPYGCKQGNCSSCKAKILEGDYELGEYSPFALMDFEKDEQFVLLCRTFPRSDLIVEMEEIEEGLELKQAQDFTAKVSQLIDYTHDIKGIFLQLDKEIDFEAGMYVDVEIPGYSLTRSYSIASSPSRRQEIELQIRHVPGGTGSTYMTHQLQMGETIRLSGPYGNFRYRLASDKEMVCVAGGSGLAPIKSILEHAFEKGEKRNITFFYGARSVKDLYLVDWMRQMEKQHPNFRFIPALSQKDQGDQWDGEEGLISDVLQKHLPVLTGKEAYLCGPPPMIDATIEVLKGGGMMESDILFDKFYTAKDMITYHGA